MNQNCDSRPYFQKLYRLFHQKTKFVLIHATECSPSKFRASVGIKSVSDGGGVRAKGRTLGSISCDYEEVHGTHRAALTAAPRRLQGPVLQKVSLCSAEPQSLPTGHKLGSGQARYLTWIKHPGLGFVLGFRCLKLQISTHFSKLHLMELLIARAEWIMTVE